MSTPMEERPNYSLYVRETPGQIGAKEVLISPNAVLHSWLQEELTQILRWEIQQAGLRSPGTLLEHSGVSGCGLMNAMRGCRPYQIVAKAPGCIKGDECRTACRRNVRFCLEPEDTGRELLWPLDGQNLQPAQEVIDWLEQTVAGMLIPHPLSGEAKATPVGSAHDFDDSLSRDCSCARLLKCGVTH